MSADFKPTIHNYKDLGSFRFWCQKVLPAVYDDSLSYYEVLCKMKDYLNGVIENMDNLHLDMEDMYTAYGQLEDYVNHYFDNLDVQIEINNKLDAMALDGSLSALIAPFVTALLPDEVASRISVVVESQLPAVVRVQLPPELALQLPAEVASQIPDLVTAWLNLHIVQPVEVIIDDSLSIEGAAADAKAAGDAIRALNSALTNVETIVIKTYTVTPTWERGNINNSGADAGSATNIRTKGFLQIESNTLYLAFDDSSYTPSQYIGYTIFLYDENGDFSSKTLYYNVDNVVVTIPNGYKVRVLISDTSTHTPVVIDVDDGDTLCQMTYKVNRNLELDKTLLIEGRPADAKATGDAIGLSKSLEVEKALAWERGKLNDSSGAYSQSTSEYSIRNHYRIPIDGIKEIIVPNGFSVKMYEYQSDNTYIGVKGSYTTNFEPSFDELTSLVRFTVEKTDSSKIAPIDGHSIKFVTITNINDETINAIKLKDNSYFNFSMFENWGVCGDSYASGGGAGGYNCSWAQILARYTGSTVTNYSTGGLATYEWLSNTTYGLNKLLSDDAKQLYALNFGINDATRIKNGELTLGDVSDIDLSDFTNNGHTFYGYYGMIIGNIMQHAPNAKIVILSVARPDERYMDASIKEIAETYSVPYIQLTDCSYFKSAQFYQSIYDGHPKAYGYAGMAKAIEELFAPCVIKYWDYFYDFNIS